jgi:hypothetical protein
MGSDHVADGNTIRRAEESLSAVILHGESPAMIPGRGWHVRTGLHYSTSIRIGNALHKVILEQRGIAE